MKSFYESIFFTNYNPIKKISGLEIHKTLIIQLGQLWPNIKELWDIVYNHMYFTEKKKKLCKKQCTVWGKSIRSL